MIGRRSNRTTSAIEAEAKAAKRGAWAGTFQFPYHWKGGKKSAAKVSCGYSLSGG